MIVPKKAIDEDILAYDIDYFLKKEESNVKCQMRNSRKALYFPAFMTKHDLDPQVRQLWIMHGHQYFNDK